MKQVYYAAQVLACTVILLTLAQLVQAQGLHYTPAELAAWRSRITSGPYKAAGDAGTNTPGDWTRIVTFSDDFKASPADTGNTGVEALDIWTGYRYQYDSLGQYPVWQGVKMQDAAFRYLLQGDTSYGNPVRRTLLKQIRFTSPVNIGYNVATWPTPSNGNALPSNESGSHEAQWLVRLIYAYDYTKNLYTAAERAEIESYFRASAWYFANRVNSVLAQNFPRRLQNDYSQKVYAAAPNGVPYWNPPVYAPVEYTRHQVWGGASVGVYTHRNADGTLGNRLPRTAYYYNNRVFDKTHLIAMAGLISGDTMLTWHAKQTCREFIRYSVFPDGTYGEYERNGDYGNPQQGAMLYGSINLQAVIMTADALARKGDMSLYTFSTTDGVHGTEVPAGGQPKSLLTVLMRYAQNEAASPDIYYGTVATGNRIDGFNENFTSTYTINYITFDYLLAVANKYYQSGYLKNVYMRQAAGTLPYPTTRLSSAGKIWVPWSGTGAEYPGMLFMFGQMENVDVYNQTAPCDPPSGLASGSITSTSARLSWTAPANLPTNGYRLEYKQTSASNWTSVATTNLSKTLNGLAANTAYQARIKSLCSGTDSSLVTATVSFTTLQTPCPAVTGLVVTPAGSTSLSVAANAAAGGVTYKIEYRTLGASSWLSTTVSAFPTVIGGLDPITAYEVRVTTNCAANTSAATATITATTTAEVCGQATTLNGTPVAFTDSARLTWAAGAGAAQYQIRLRPQSSTNWKFVVVSTPYHTENLLNAGVTYEFQVNTVCNSTVSGYTASRTFTMPVPPCNAPTGLAISGITQTGATAAFTGNGPRYEIAYRAQSASAWTLDTVAASPYTFTGLTAATTYDVKVRTLCTSNASPYSALVSFTTLTPPCPAVTNVVATATSPSAATVTFTGTNTAEVAYKLTSSSTWSIASTSTASPFSLSGLNDGSAYQVRVTALCGSNRAPSVTANFTTPVAPTPCDTVQALVVTAVMFDRATVTWQAVPGNTMGYKVRFREVGTSNWTQTNASSTTASVTMLQPATRFEVQVQTICSSTLASAWTSSRYFTTASLPCGMPTAINAQILGADTAKITWTPPASTTGYLVRLQNLTHPSTRDFTLGALIRELGIGHLTSGDQYKIAVMSYCTSGQSSWLVDTLFMPAACAATGVARRESWLNVHSWFPGQPVPARRAEDVQPISSLSDSIVAQAGILRRVRGFICVPATGAYTFGLAGSTKAELRLSTIPGDTDRASSIISVQTSTRLFNYAAIQLSAPVQLQGGGRYYVEVIYFGSDPISTFSLAWTTPISGLLSEVPQARFTTTAPAFGSPVTGLATPTAIAWTLAPNPAGSQGTRLYGPSGQVSVEIIDAAGRPVSSGKLEILAGTPADLSHLLPATPGVYAVVARSGTELYRTRLVRE